MNTMDAQSKQRKIIHIDADCFYAAIEMRDDPSLRGIPLAVGGSAQKRGVIATCNYEAREFGVHSAMTTAYALKLCSNLVVIPPNMEKYREASQGIHKVLQRFTHDIEPLSLDEAYLDVSQASHCRGSATLMAESIRREVKDALGITVSAGVASNKMLAKIASDWQKPNGLFVIPPEETQSFMTCLPVRKLPGVGKVTAKKLKSMGIETCFDLQQLSRLELHTRFGSYGEQLFQLCRGIDHRRVKPSRIRKSLSVEHTYERDLPRLEDCIRELPQLYQAFQNRKQKSTRQYDINKAFVKVKFNDFTTTTVERRADEPSLDAFRDLCEEAVARQGLPVRLLGLGVRLKPKDNIQLTRQLELFNGQAMSI